MAIGPPQVTRFRVRAAPSAGGVIGAALFGAVLVVAIIAILALLGLVRSSMPSVVLWLILLLATGAVIGLGYLLFGYFTLSYELTERALAIRWGNRSEEIPLADIVYAGPAAPVLGSHRSSWQWFWPGYYLGTRSTALGPVHVAATQSVSRQLLVSTASAHYAISPERPALFLERLAEARQAALGQEPARPAQIAGRQQLADAGWTVEFSTVSSEATIGTGQHAGTSLPQGGRARFAARRAVESRPLRLFLVEDRIGLSFLLLSLALGLAMVLYLLLRYEQLPETLALHWNANGLPDRIGTRRDLWLLPFIMAIVTVANIGLAWLAEAFDRFAARLLLAGSCLVQLVAWVALLSIVR